MKKILCHFDRADPIDHSFISSFFYKYISNEFIFNEVLFSKSRTGKSGSGYYCKHHKSRIRRYLNFIFHFPAILAFILKKDPDYYFVRNDPLFGMMFLIAAAIRNKIFIFQLSHLKEEQLLETQRSKFSLLIRISIAVRNLLIRKSDVFIPISKSMVNHLKEKYGIDQKPSDLVFGMGYDQEDPASVDTRQYGEYALYVGTLDKIRAPSFFIGAFVKYIQESKSEINLVLLGGDTNKMDKLELQNWISRLNLQGRIFFHPDVSRKEVFGFIENSKFCISVIPPSPVNSTISPTKIFEYLSLEKPCITNSEIIGQAEISNNGEFTYEIKYDQNSLLKAFYQLDNNITRYQSVAKLGSEFIKKNHTYKSMAVIFIKTLNEVSKKGYK